MQEHHAKASSSFSGSVLQTYHGPQVYSSKAFLPSLPAEEAITGVLAKGVTQPGHCLVLDDTQIFVTAEKQCSRVYNDFRKLLGLLSPRVKSEVK